MRVMGINSLVLLAWEMFPLPKSRPKKAMQAQIVIFKSIRLSTFWHT